MKSFICLSFLSFLFLSPAGVWGMENTVEFTGDLEAFKRTIQSLPQTSGGASHPIHVTITASPDCDFDPFIDEIKKIGENLATLKVTKSPAGTANYLIAALQEEGGVPKLTELDLSENTSVGGGSITFCGLEGLLKKIPIKTLRLAKNDLSETMDCILEGILSSANHLTTLDLSHTNPTPQMLSHLIDPLMFKQRTLPLTLILRDNPLGEERMSMIQSLLSTTNGDSRSLEDLDLRNCHISEASLIEAVGAYLVQGSCAHLFCDDKRQEAHVIHDFLLKPIKHTLRLLKKSEIPLIDSLERLKTLSEDNPDFKSSLKRRETLRDYVDGLLDDLASSEAATPGKKGAAPQNEKWGELKKYFTGLF